MAFKLGGKRQARTGGGLPQQLHNGGSPFNQLDPRDIEERYDDDNTEVEDERGQELRNQKEKPLPPQGRIDWDEEFTGDSQVASALDPNVNVEKP
jgi:hypothetical protein